MAKSNRVTNSSCKKLKLTIFNVFVCIVVIIVIILLIIYKTKEKYTKVSQCPSTYTYTDGTVYNTFMNRMSDSTPNTDGQLVCRYGRNCENRIHLGCDSWIKKTNYCKNVRSVTYDNKNNEIIPGNAEFSASTACEQSIGWKS